MKISAFVVVTALSVCLAKPQGLEEPTFTKVTSRLNARIVDGTTVNKGTKWPWQVSLQTYGAYSCSGSIIGSKWIVTAAHCVEDEFASKLSIRAGTTTSNSGGVTKKVASIAVSAGYKSMQQRYVNDIAVLELDSDLLFSSSIKAIEMTSLRSRSLTSSECYITGWGRTNGTSSISSNLMEAEIPVISDSQCKKSWSSSIKNDVNICVKGEGKGACIGDDGGPLVCRVGSDWQLAGVQSWGPPSCSTSYPSVYAEVAHFKNAILKYIGQ